MSLTPLIQFLTLGILITGSNPKDDINIHDFDYKICKIKLYADPGCTVIKWEANHTLIDADKNFWRIPNKYAIKCIASKGDPGCQSWLLKCGKERKVINGHHQLIKNPRKLGSCLTRGKRKSVKL